MEQSFERDIHALEKVFDLFHRFVREQNIDHETSLTMDLIAEEVFTNFVRHNPDAFGEIVIRLSVVDDRITMQFIDSEAKPYDITQRAEPDLDRPLQEKRPGGLGIYLVKKYSDSVEYQYQDGKSTITITKRLERSHAGDQTDKTE